MSLITKSDFVAKIRNNKNKLYDLLDKFELTERIVDDFNNLNYFFEKHIDYKVVNNYILNFRKMSMDYIISCLESTYEQQY